MVCRSKTSFQSCVFSPKFSVGLFFHTIWTVHHMSLKFIDDLTQFYLTVKIPIPKCNTLVQFHIRRHLSNCAIQPICGTRISSNSARYLSSNRTAHQDKGIRKTIAPITYIPPAIFKCTKSVSQLRKPQTVNIWDGLPDCRVFQSKAHQYHPPTTCWRDCWQVNRTTYEKRSGMLHVRCWWVVWGLGW